MLTHVMAIKTGNTAYIIYHYKGAEYCTDDFETRDWETESYIEGEFIRGFNED